MWDEEEDIKDDASSIDITVDSGDIMYKGTDLG